MSSTDKAAFRSALCATILTCRQLRDAYRREAERTDSAVSHAWLRVRADEWDARARRLLQAIR